MRILAVDPGLANTGIVLVEDNAIVRVLTLKTQAEGARPDFATAVRRAHALASDLEKLHFEIGDVDVVVVEAYRDIPGKLRGAKNRWATPLAIGVMVLPLQEFSPGGGIVWQDPELVMTRYAGAVRMWELGRRGLIQGDEALRNEHVRSAAAHAMHYLDGERSQGRRTRGERA